jgi:FkbM family methyltransferase
MKISKAIRSLKCILQYGIEPVYRRQKLRIHSHYIPHADTESQQSQFGQDVALMKYVDVSKKGFFVDIGAHDGVTGSNSFMFEKKFGWDGVCFEPNPILFQRCQKNRACSCENSCISSQAGKCNFLSLPDSISMLGGIEEFMTVEHLKRIERALKPEERLLVKKISINSVELTDYLVKKGRDHVDLLLIDVEGAEMNILKSIDFLKTCINVICVENNYHGDEIAGYLHKFGYELKMRIACDEIYKKKLI